jgi:HlyD family secretion protein
VRGKQPLAANADDFKPALLAIQARPPSPLPRRVLHLLLALFAILIVWSLVGRLDIIAVAPGKLVPLSYLQTVQPAEAGIVKEWRVREGNEVKAGQVLIRMDTHLSEADNRQLKNELDLRRLQLRRIEAELAGKPMIRQTDDRPDLFVQAEAQYRARRQAYQDALDAERAALAKAEHDLKAARETEAKLKQTQPIYKEQEAAWNQLAKEGYAGKLLALERSRQRIENEGELKAQGNAVMSLGAATLQLRKKIAQIESNYRSQLANERVEVEAQTRKFQEDWEKQTHRHGLLELKAPQDGIVKDLAAHTIGSVVQPGTVLLTLIPHNEPVQAEVWVANLDAGFVRGRQPAKVKFAAYPFQQYGMVEGEVTHISPDATEQPPAKAATNGGAAPLQETPPSSGYRALVALRTPFLESDGIKHRLTPGMQVQAEIHLGTRTVMEYLTSPIKKTVLEAGRER